VTQAQRDWQRLGDGGTPPSLVTREPQLRAAEAAKAVAEAKLAQARLDLERTAIVAPYAGRIRSRDADLGQVIAAGGRVAAIYATDAVEIALPIKNRDLSFIDLPEGGIRDDAGYQHVRVTSELSPGVTWPARLVRTEGAIDDASRQLRVVARIDDPFSAEHGSPIKIGQYVAARIDGRTLPDALVIPNDAIAEGSFVYVVANGILERRDVVVAWRNDADAVVASGLVAGEALVVTPLGQVNSGTRVRVRDDGEGGERLSTAASGGDEP
jgi:RND family efflux transporter MFP subunit